MRKAMAPDAAGSGPTLGQRIRMNAAAVYARGSVRVKASFRERSWLVGETLFPFLAMSAFVLVYRGLPAPREYGGVGGLGGGVVASLKQRVLGKGGPVFLVRGP